MVLPDHFQDISVVDKEFFFKISTLQENTLHALQGSPMPREKKR